MNPTFLLAVFLIMTTMVGISSVVVYLVAESKWRRHPLARCTYQRAASFSTSY